MNKRDVVFVFYKGLSGAPGQKGDLGSPGEKVSF